MFRTESLLGLYRDQKETETVLKDDEYSEHVILMFARQRLLNFPITSYFAILSPGKQCRFFAWLGVLCKQLHCRSCLAKTNFFNPPDEVWGTGNAFSHGREHLVIHVAAAVWGARGRCHDGATVWLAEFSGRLLHGDWGATNLYRDLGAFR